MPDANDIALMREYADSGSETAFAELVHRHINLVYSVALRYVGNSQDAQDVTQAVFIILAQKAASLRERTILTGWLYETTRFTASQLLRTRNRRQAREQEVYMQSTLNDSNPDNLWQQLAPLLENAMTRLNEKERTLLALRFFENKSGAETAAILGIQEWAAHKRVNRAVEKLRKFFTKRGVILPAAVLTAAISSNSVQAAPVALAKSVTAVAIAKGSIAAASTLTLVKGTMKTMAWLKLKFAAVVGVSAIITIAVSTVVVAKHTKSPDANAESSVTTDDSLLIVPGVSVGKVKAGMSEDEIIAALGKPEKMQGEVMIYDKQLGFSVVCSRKKLVGAVFCGGGVATNEAPAVASATNESPAVFKGRTKEGIGIDSSRYDLIKTFAQPTSDNLWAVGQERLEYKPLGLTFTLQSGKVFHIIVDFRKPQ
jgi:RNA polymerase sigma factor (sigma-70 family)